MAARMSAPVPGLEPELLSTLERHRWPGNVRELKHVMEAALVLAAPGDIGVQHLPASFRSSPPAQTAPPSPVVEPLTAAERAAIVAALEACGGNQSRAARQLGISRRTLIYKMRKHDIRTIKDVR
jgi:DNA-binding NtrC family response regulator